MTSISIDACTADYGIGLLIESKQIVSMNVSFVGEHKNLLNYFHSGALEIKLYPMGTLVEKVRSGGAGIPAFYTKTGVHTLVHSGNVPSKYRADGSVVECSKPKETRVFEGKDYLLEPALTADFACIKVGVQLQSIVLMHLCLLMLQ